jgi:hypothetical protein
VENQRWLIEKLLPIEAANNLKLEFKEVANLQVTCSPPPPLQSGFLSGCFFFSPRILGAMDSVSKLSEWQLGIEWRDNAQNSAIKYSCLEIVCDEKKTGVAAPFTPFLTTAEKPVRKCQVLNLDNIVLIPTKFSQWAHEEKKGRQIDEEESRGRC